MNPAIALLLIGLLAADSALAEGNHTFGAHPHEDCLHHKHHKEEDSVLHDMAAQRIHGEVIGL